MFRSAHPSAVAAAIAWASFALVPHAPAHAADGEFLTALEQTTPLLDMRLRSETTGQAGKPDTAEALTLRGRFGFETGRAWGTSLLAEGVALTPIVENYNSTLNGKTQYPSVSDPETSQLNRLQLKNSSLPDTSLIVGRSRITLDDQRFIGNSNWRQLEQTFDAVRLINGSIPDVTVDLTYLNRVNRVYGKNSPQGTYRGDNYLANVGVGTPLGKLVGFAYLTDFDIAPTDSTRTLGVRFAGDRRLGDFGLGYSLAYATQRDRANNPLRFQNDYWQGQLSGALSGVTVAAGAEILAGNGVKAFTTPLASLHQFQGWGEQFTTHPPNGIDDRFGSIAYAANHLWDFPASITATALYHRFRSARLDIDYGSEIDATAKAAWSRFAVTIEYADYKARQYSSDTHKLWAIVEFIL